MKSEKRKKSPAEILKLRRRMESISTLGLILVLIALVAAVFAPDSVKWLLVYKILYAVGAVGYTAARMVNVNDPDDSVRVRRIRRMEVWAGLALVAGAFFWFYNTWGLPNPMQMTVYAMRDTILFTFAGAIIQIVASVLLTVQANKKEKNGKEPNKGKTSKQDNKKEGK